MRISFTCCSTITVLLLAIFINLSHSIVMLRDRHNYRTGTNYVGDLSKENSKICKQQTIKQKTNTQKTSQSSSSSSQQQQNQLPTTCFPPRVKNPQTLACQCLFETVYFPKINECLCPIQRPLWSGKGCVQCPFQISDGKGRTKCSLCPQGFIAKLQNGNTYCEGELQK